MTNYRDEYIFISGGRYKDDIYPGRVWYYCVQTNRWGKAPDLTLAKASHSTCTIEDYIYVAGGKTNET